MEKEGNKSILFFGIIISIILVAYFVFADSDATMSSPVVGGNYSTTLSFIATSDFNTTSEMDYNVTLYCNASGGDIDNETLGDLIVTVSNTSALQNAFNDTAVDIASLAEGADYNCSAYADNGTDQNFSVAVTSITIDHTAPNVSAFVTVVGYQNYTSDVTINVTVSENLTAVSSVYFNITNNTGDEVNWSIATNETADEGGAYVFILDDNTLEDGDYNITAFVNDTVNNVNSTESISITIDNSGPASAFVNLDYGNYSGDITINATITDAIAIDSVYFNITDGANDQVNLTAGTAAGDSYSFVLHQTSLIEGDYNITIYSNDTLDNVNSTEYVQITIDNTPPNVSAFVTVIDMQNYTSDITINVTVSENTTAISSVYFNITNNTGDEVNWSIATNETADEGGAYVFILDDNTLEDGDYNITAFVNDTTSPANANNTEYIQIRIDNTAPNVSSFLNVVAWQNYTTDVTINASVSDALMGLDSVYFNITNGTNDQMNLTAGEAAGGYYSFILYMASIADGDYNLTAFANDTQLDNVNSTEYVQFRVDNTPPNVSAFVTIMDMQNYTSDITINVTVSDALMGVDSVYFNITNNTGDQVNLTTATNETADSGGAYVFILDDLTLADGDYNVTAFANDTQLNNENNTEYVQFRIDNTVPTVTNFTTTVNAGNYSGVVALNVSVEDALMGLDSVYFNITNVSNDQINFSIAANETDDAYYNITFDSTTWVDGSYNVTVYANDTQLDNVNSTETITIMIDNGIAPLFATPVTFVDNGNYSGTIFLNVSVVDYIGVSDVFFNLTNVSNDQNYSFETSQQSTSNYWNSSTINTSTYADGTYNISIWANDTNGNLNDSIASYIVIFDSTNPGIGLSRSSSSTSTSLIIAVSVSDVTSGVVSGTSCTVNRAGAAVSGSGASQTITETGLVCSESYSYTVTCSDEAGNNASVTEAFFTEGCGGGGTGPGGGGTTTSRTYNIAASQLEEGYTKQLSSADQIKFNLNEESHSIKVDSLSATTATITLSSTPQTVTLSEGDEKKFELTGDNYYDLSLKLNEIANSKADLTIISIKEEIPAEICTPDWTCADWSACEAEQKTRTCTDAEACGTDEGKPAEAEACGGDDGEDDGEGLDYLTWIIVIVVIAIIAIAIGYTTKKKKKKSKK